MRAWTERECALAEHARIRNLSALLSFSRQPRYESPLSSDSLGRELAIVRCPFISTKQINGYRNNPAWHCVRPWALGAIELGLQFVCAADDGARGVSVLGELRSFETISGCPRIAFHGPSSARILPRTDAGCGTYRPCPLKWATACKGSNVLINDQSENHSRRFNLRSGHEALAPAMAVLCGTHMGCAQLDDNRGHLALRCLVLAGLRASSIRGIIANLSRNARASKTEKGRLMLQLSQLPSSRSN
jgi:hypothetical protein